MKLANFKKLFGTGSGGAEISDIELDMEELPQLPPSKPGTLIAKGQVLEGALRGEGTVQVEGVVVGEIALRGALIVACGGTVKGPVEADVVRVAGHIEGTILARQHLRMERSGRVDGNISTASLVVDDGARFNGSCTSLDPPPQSDPAVDQMRPAFEKLQFGPNYVPDLTESAVEQTPVT